MADSKMKCYETIQTRGSPQKLSPRKTDTKEQLFKRPAMEN